MERLERQVLADRQIAALQAVMSGQGGDLPTFSAQQAALDAALNAESEPLSAVGREQMELRRALGVT